MSSSYLPATTDSIAQALSEAISILYRVLENPSSSPDALRIKEQAITNLSDLLRQENRAEELRSLLTQLRPLFALIPKAKTAKIVRGIIDDVAKIPGTSDLQISLCKEVVQWTHAEKRTFLRQRVEAKLAALLMENKEYQEALNLLSGLIKEVRRLDDKLLLVDIDLLESKLHFSLRNLPKAKASLTAARTAANAIYVPPAQQAFEAFNALEDPRAVFSLKYMLLCKIMVSQADDVAGIISSKAGLQYVGPELDAMKAVADAHAKRSLKLFEIALRDFKAQLEEDPIVHRHLSSLYDTLLEQNLCRLIEPFSRVEIAHIAELIELPVVHVEKKLSQMILDKKFAGTLDQGNGCLIIFDDTKTDAIYPATLETISNIGKVVDSLYVRSVEELTARGTDGKVSSTSSIDKKKEKARLSRTSMIHMACSSNDAAVRKFIEADGSLVHAMEYDDPQDFRHEVKVLVKLRHHNVDHLELSLTRSPLRSCSAEDAVAV
ncbi:26S proteasome non-ATPase regulatory subunit 11-like protein [Hibiscus syriacus]|uniref:26S proteasome non-ATPase regulatory subunit 11-like protein n=1 Tax=Hibiscus syriacus TaxID=106335 RepID=A0A6A2YF29_HIBSY|nr:26S proteasome non-ATPase regulatory subunit 11-like protein [Hibiscus syriacus]